MSLKNSSTLVLKAAVWLIGLAVLALCGFLLSVLLRQEAGDYAPVLVGMLIAALPFYRGLYQAYQLLTNIDGAKAFSNNSLAALKSIKYCAGLISALYLLLAPLIFIAAERDDAPGAIVIGLVIIFASFILAVFAAVLQKLFQTGLELKAENDLTV